MKKFELNGKKYDVLPLDFNTVCDLDDLGISLGEFGTKQTKFVRAYIALATGMSITEAGIEIQNHIINGGDISAIGEIINKEIEESDFFQALQKRAETEDSEMEKPKKK